MRVVAGVLRSRKIEAVEGMETRPTADRIKEAVFSRIGPYFAGGNFLDLYGGSGNIGIEAVSRGIDQVVCCDVNKKAIKTIENNLRLLKIAKQFKVMHCSDAECLEYCHKAKISFNYIYLDPPYRLQQNQEIVQRILDLELLDENGVLIIEGLKEDEPRSWKGMVCVKEANYGITKIRYYEREGLNDE